MVIVHEEREEKLRRKYHDGVRLRLLGELVSLGGDTLHTGKVQSLRKDRKVPHGLAKIHFISGDSRLENSQNQVISEIANFVSIILQRAQTTWHSRSAPSNTERE